MILSDQQRKALAVLRDVQGLPVTVLLVFFIARKPLTKKDLCKVLRRSYNTISDTVDFLETAGHIERHGYRVWSLPSGQLALPGFENLHFPSVSPSTPSTPSIPATVDQESASMRTKTAPANEKPASVRGDPRNIKNSRFETSNFDVSLTTTTVSKKVKEEKVVGTSVRETSNFDVSPELQQAFREGPLSIGRNAWAQLAAKEWVTPDYVRAMRARTYSHPDPAKRNTGFMIHCMRSGDDPPEEWCSECLGVDGEHCRDCSQWVNPYARAAKKYGAEY